VDVVAPGIGVTSVGSGVRAINGTQYAVAVAAGVATLVRSAYPNLTAAQVAHRIEMTSVPLGGSAVPDSSTGWGVVSAGSTVTKVLAEQNHDVRAATATGRGAGSAGAVAWAALAVLVVLFGLAATAVLARRPRRARAGAAARSSEPVEAAAEEPVKEPVKVLDHAELVPRRQDEH
jgi:membrane-anchored mycosin MYCP